MDWELVGTYKDYDIYKHSGKEFLSTRVSAIPTGHQLNYDSEYYITDKKGNRTEIKPISIKGIEPIPILLTTIKRFINYYAWLEKHNFKTTMHVEIQGGIDIKCGDHLHVDITPTGSLTVSLANMEYESNANAYAAEDLVYNKVNWDPKTGKVFNATADVSKKQQNKSCANCKYFIKNPPEQSWGDNCTRLPHDGFEILGQGFDGLRVYEDFYCKFFEPKK